MFFNEENERLYTALAKRIRKLMQERPNGITVAIDGPCTSGKSTLADRIAKDFAGECSVFRIDDFFLRDEQATPERLATAGGNIDHERFAAQVLDNLSAKEPFSYRPFDWQTRDFAAAKANVRDVLAVKPNDAPALNLRAVCEAAAGDSSAAEKTLDQAIRSNPRDYHAYYNMANLMLQARGSADVARRYYETGRAVGGPKDKALEEAFK
jgi:tetratricopeptide (TPR) repeat protein